MNWISLNRNQSKRIGSRFIVQSLVNLHISIFLSLSRSAADVSHIYQCKYSHEYQWVKYVWNCQISDTNNRNYQAFKNMYIYIYLTICLFCLRMRMYYVLFVVSCFIEMIHVNSFGRLIDLKCGASLWFKTMEIWSHIDSFFFFFLTHMCLYMWG